MLFKTLFITIFLIQQTESTDVPTTNSGSEFVDPFAEEEAPSAEEETTPDDIETTDEAPMMEESAQQPADPVFPSEEPASTQETPAQTEPPLERQNTVESQPLEEESPLENPEENPEENFEESPKENLEEDFQPPVQNFEFPDVEEPQGPVSQSVRDSELSQYRTQVGAWHMGFGTGFAANLNRRPSQFHGELYGGYRLWEDFDLGALLSMRARSDILLGFYATSKYYVRLTDPEQMRIELAMMAGLGWTLKEINDKFREGRFSFRTGVDGLFYVNPFFAIVSSLAMDTHLFAVDTDGEAVNLFKGQGGSHGGPPTQLLLLLGVRFDF